MFKRGTVVQHKVNPWIGVATQPDNGQYVSVKWFEGRDGGGYVMNEGLTPISGYEFEAALALGDTAKVLELYRALQSALAPFAAYGHLKLQYPDKAVFTVAYDRNGQAVMLFFSDFTRAAALLPRPDQPEPGGAQIGGRGGIAEIMEVKP